MIIKSNYPYQSDLSQTNQNVADINMLISTMQTQISALQTKVNSLETNSKNYFPDYSKKYVVSSGFVAPSNGWIYSRIWADNGNQDSNVFINGIECTHGGASGSGVGMRRGIMVPISKGQTVTRNGTGVQQLNFIPCIGE